MFAAFVSMDAAHFIGAVEALCVLMPRVLKGERWTFIMRRYLGTGAVVLTYNARNILTVFELAFCFGKHFLPRQDECGKRQGDGALARDE
jgi:hypothetical protein